MTTLESEIWRAVKIAVPNMKLPQSGAMVGEVRLCPESGQDFPWSSHERLGNWKAFKEVLQKRRPGGLSGLNMLLPGVDTPTREQVICTFNPGAHFTTRDLEVLPLFPIGGQDMPVGASDYCLFFPPQDGQPQPAPESIRIAFLQKQFSEECSKKAGGASLLKTLGVSEFSPANIAKAFSAQELESIQPEVLWNYLQSVVTPMLKNSDAVMDWKDKHRASLIERINVPCRNGAWRPAIEVYAGQDWTGDNFLEHAYASRSDRAFLCTPPEDEEDRKHFKLLARWLGVGWSPKVAPVANYADKSETQEGVRWSGGVFPVTPMPSKWREHCAELTTTSHCNFDRYTARLRQDWTIDGDEAVLRLPGVFAYVVREWGCYKDFLQSIVYRSSNRQRDNDKEKLWPSASYLAHLFKHEEWIPAEEGDRLAAARDVFIQEERVHEELKGWVFAPSVEVNTAVAKEIGIRAGWDDVKREDWLRWLKRSLELKPTRTQVYQAHITALYQQALRHFGDRYDERDQRLWYEAIWCVEKRPDNTAVWHLEGDSRKIFYVDRPDLSRLRWDKLRIFPVELGWSGNRDKVRNIFGVSPLSVHLRGMAEFTGGERDELSEKIRERFENRVRCLAAFLKVRGNEAEAAQERWKELFFHVGHGLRVNFLLNGGDPEIQPAPTFFQTKTEQTEPALWLDAIDNFDNQGQPRDIAWEEVGSALCYTAGLPLEDGTVFCALLSCGEDSLKRKLLNLRVTELDVQTALAPIGRREESGEPQPPSPKPLPEDKSRRTEPIEDTVAETIVSMLDDIAPDGDLKALSKKLANETPERIEAIVERIARGDSKLIQALKQAYQFRCQFPSCGKRIPKKEGGFYIEVAHIKPVRLGGPSVLGNLLVLCPNHHKEFDFGQLEFIEQTPELLHGKLNGIEFKIYLSRA